MIEAPTVVQVPMNLGAFMHYRDLMEVVADNLKITRPDGSLLGFQPLHSPDLDARRADALIAFGRGHEVVAVEPSTVQSVEVPPDLYLRGLLGDIETMAAMACEEFGPLRVPTGLLEAADEWVGVPTDPLDDEWHWRSLCKALKGNGIRRELRGDEEVIFGHRTDGTRMVLPLHLYAVVDQLFLLLLYRAVAITALNLAELSQEDEATLEHVAAEWSRHRELPAPKTARQVLLTTSRLVNFSTRGLAPRLELFDTETDEALSGERGADLLTVLVGQIAAQISEGTPVRQCANENCKTYFTYQAGRARYGQRHSSGVLYCTSSCAKAAAQRAYRRRQKQGSQEGA